MGSTKSTNCPYLCQTTSNPKYKGTFFSSTFKVWEEKVPSDFHLKTNWPRYGRFVDYPVIHFVLENDVGSTKSTNQPYLCQTASNPKNKGTSFSSTFKVWEIKVPSDFHLEPN